VLSLATSRPAALLVAWRVEGAVATVRSAHNAAATKAIATTRRVCFIRIIKYLLNGPVRQDDGNVVSRADHATGRPKRRGQLY
jgi:hypothetical protein